MNEHEVIDPSPGALPFEAFRTHGLLWLINTAVFHPRGYAVSFEMDDHGRVTGWKLLGDGTERWAYSADPEMTAALDETFLAVKALMP